MTIIGAIWKFVENCMVRHFCVCIWPDFGIQITLGQEFTKIHSNLHLNLCGLQCSVEDKLSRFALNGYSSFVLECLLFHNYIIQTIFKFFLLLFFVCFFYFVFSVLKFVLLCDKFIQYHSILAYQKLFRFHYLRLRITSLFGGAVRHPTLLHYAPRKFIFSIQFLNTLLIIRGETERQGESERGKAFSGSSFCFISIRSGFHGVVEL